MGLAIRAGTGLGLNMRNESPNTPNALKEIRYRVWWSLYMLEHQLGNMTGRATSVSDESCTTPLPVPYDEDKFYSEDGTHLLSVEMQKGGRNPSTCPLSSSATESTTTPSERSTSAPKTNKEKSRSPSSRQFPDLSWAKNVTPNGSLYFLEYLQLTRLTQQILSRLYTPLAAQKSWSEIQTVISALNADLESWSRDLPPIFDFKRKLRDQEFMDFRWSLGFFYYSTRMKINRPCLCRLDKKLPAQSDRSREFNRDAACRCVEAALEMLALIPDEPNAVGLNRIGPWWNILHYLVQSATVIMLEMSFRASHMPEEASTLLKAAKKAVRWLHQMAEDNVSAKRAWRLCDSMLRETAPRIGETVEDLPLHASGQEEDVYGEHDSLHRMPVHTMSNQQLFSRHMPDFDSYFMSENYQPYVEGMEGVLGEGYQPVTSAPADFVDKSYHGQGQPGHEQDLPRADCQQ